MWFFPKPPSAGYSLDDITAESRANVARLNTTEGNFFCFIGAGSLKDKSVAQSFTGVDQLPEFPRSMNWGATTFWNTAMTYEVSPTYRLPASPEGTNGVQELQLHSSWQDPECMEQHPDTIALEMITDAEAEPFLALSDVESHRRTAEYKGHKKQLEELMGGIWPDLSGRQHFGVFFSWACW